MGLLVIMCLVAWVGANLAFGAFLMLRVR